MRISHGTKQIALIGALGLTILSGCGQQPSQVGPMQAGPPEVAVTTIQPQRLVITTELSGRTSANRIAEVRPQVGGIIQKRLFTEGTDVKAGQVLYEIDPAPYRAARDGAAANLAAAQKTAERTRAALQAGLAGVTRQRVTLELAQTNRQRFEEAFKERAVSAGQRDQAVTEADVAAAALQAAEAQVESDRKAIAAAEAAVQQAEAALKTARINMEYTSVAAPISGRIGRSGVTEGALVAAYQPTPLTVIQQLDPMYVDVPQSATELLQLRRRLEEGQLRRSSAGGNRVRLLLEDNSRYPWEGSLQFRDVTVDQSTGSVILRVIVPNPKGYLMPGMFVRAIVEEGVNPSAILVPQQAVSRNPKGNPLVLVLDAQGKVAQRLLTLDRAIGDQWLVASGLSAGERVIVEGLQKARPGASVMVVSSTGSADKAGEEGKKASRPARAN